MDKYWIWFSKLNTISVKIKNELLKIYKTPEKIWNLTKKDLQETDILSSKEIEIIQDINNRQNLEKYIEYMCKNNIKMITIQDKKYPENLKNIFDPPVVLYVIGNTQILKSKSIAIIGTRNCSNYGKNIARKFAYNLSKQNINIVSGLARGIDTYAHIGAIEAGEKTIAVVGGGLDTVYPEENKNIFQKIIEQGAVISEYVVGTKPEKTNFPARNRIISAISDGVLVVEATKKSGTFITVDFALEHGKNVYAIPGNINSSMSLGTNELIKQGAKMVTTESDILEDFS